MVVAICDQNQKPREIHEPPADDKLVLFALPRVTLLEGRWQGPGTIAQLRCGRP
jgi:hypothetical protein